MDDPVALAIIEALARRAAAQQGQARDLLARRVEALQAEQAAATRPVPAADAALQDSAGRQAALAGLRDLVDRLGRPGRAQASPGLADSPPRPLKALTAFKGTWSRLRAEQRLREALAQVPAKAGPLHSSHVVHRALQAMHALSPAYLDAFMSHVDALLWLEQVSGGGDLAPRPAARAERGRRPPAAATRKT